MNPYYRNTHAYRFRTHSCCISHLASQSPLGSRLSVLLARPWSPYHSCIYTHLALLLCFTRFSSLALQRQHAELTRNSASLLHTRVLTSRLSVILAKPWSPSHACTLVSLKHMQFMKQALVSLDQCLDKAYRHLPSLFYSQDRGGSCSAMKAGRIDKEGVGCVASTRIRIKYIQTKYTFFT